VKYSKTPPKSQAFFMDFSALLRQANFTILEKPRDDPDLP
jgi:hypothetical protein